MSTSRPTPANRFKQRLRAGEVQIGLWSVLADASAAELLAGCGYDWLLLDAEHGPNDLHTVLAQLRGIAAAATVLGDDAEALSQPVVRLPHGDAALVKQYPRVKVIRVEDVSVSIFTHERESGGSRRVNYSCSFQRSYKDPTGVWKRTPWFGPDDLGNLVACAQQAHAHIESLATKGA